MAAERVCIERTLKGVAIMFIRKGMDELMHRVKTFCNSSRNGIALMQIRNISTLNKPLSRTLNKWQFPNELHTYLDEMVQRFLYNWSQREEIDDDLIPAIYPWFGIAEHSAFVGGNVDFTDNTSWHHPVIKDWNDMELLQLDENNEWLRMVVGGIEYLRDRSGGRYAVKLRGADGPMDIANALRGNDFFTDFFEYPDEVHKLMNFSTKAAEWILSHQKKAAGLFYGGTITGFDVWLPGDSIGHLSEDASTMCSPEIYTEFGMPYTSRLCSKYENAFMHTHALGQHNISNIATIEKINYIEISNDPNCPRAIEIYRKLAPQLSHKIVVVEMTLDEIRQNMDFLKSVKTIIWYSAKDLDDARNAIKLVRDELMP